MRYSKRILTAVFAIVLLIGSAVVSTSAQQRGTIIYRPVVVRPFYGYNRFWNRWYDPFWGDPSFYDPYYRERQQRAYLQGAVKGNRRELQKHLEKYNKDGVITAKERAELEDDYRDVRRAEQRLEDFENDE